MSIVRAHFETCGQDFSWWDVDDESGAIVDCGPFQAWMWTQYVVLLPLAAGERPVLVAPPHGDLAAALGQDEIEPVALRYRVEKIEPARHAA